MNDLPVLGNETEHRKRRGLLGRCRDVARSLMRIPLFSKIVLANSALAVLLGTAGATAAVWHVKSFPTDPHYDLIVLFVAAGLAVNLVVNFVAMKLALTPLDRLHKAADKVRQGTVDTSVMAGPVSDEQLDLLINTFNQMLSTLRQDAQQLHHLSQQVAHAREEERQRIARELHDEAAQTLTSLLLYLKLLEKSQNPEEVERIRNLRKLAAYALNEIRQVGVDFYPKILQDWGLEAAVCRRVDELNAADFTQVILQIEGDVQERLPRDLELAFYRVVQEALNNIALHSQARHAQVTLKREANWLWLEVQDDGIGFNTAAMQGERSGGSGISGMRDRLATVGGEFAIESQVGHGTRIIARAPLASP